MYTGKKGDVSQAGMERLCNDIGRDLCQVSTHRLHRTTQKESSSKEMWIQRLYFIRVGQTNKEGDMLVKAGEQFENHRLVKFPTRIPKLNKEERRKMSKVLTHCKAEAQFKPLSSSPKQMQATKEARPLPKTNLTEVLPSQLDDRLFLDIGQIFRGEQEDKAAISRHEQ